MCCVVTAAVEFSQGHRVLFHAFNSIFGYFNLLESCGVGGLIVNEIVRRKCWLHNKVAKSLRSG